MNKVSSPITGVKMDFLTKGAEVTLWGKIKRSISHTIPKNKLQVVRDLNVKIGTRQVP